MGYSKFPCSVEDTIENLCDLKEIMQQKVIIANMHGRGEKDAEEVAFDLDRAINALKENQVYKKLGTLEEMKILKSAYLIGAELDELYYAVKRLNEYKKIGALEKFMEMAERQKPKQQIIERFWKDV